MQNDCDLEQQKMNSLAEFAAGIGHEINNPLAIISGHAQLLLGQIENPQQRRSLAIIASQVKRAYEMIADIRLFARPPKPQMERFDLVAKIDELRKNQLPFIAEHSIDFRFEHEDSKIYIISDPTQISVALLALIRNAAESIGTADGTIKVSARLIDLDEYKVEITVCDNGPGILPEILPLIFSPYFSGRQAGRGLGFGLPKTWQILKQCNGTIEVESEPSVETKFTIRLP